MSAVLASVRLPEVLRVARLRSASDVHVRAGRPPAFRIDGTLQHMSGVSVSAEEMESLAYAMLTDHARRSFETSGDATVTYVDADLGRFRVHAYRAGEQVQLAIRLLAAKIPLFEDLDLPASIASLVARNSGLVLITGPTGSGKSTVLAALVDRINCTSARHIITVEDPVEYVHDTKQSIVSQRAVPVDVRDFSAAVYGALRADPDVLMIGELRDPSTIYAALTAAETGHLVLATLHTGDACKTVERIISVFDAEAQSQVRLQLAQTLAGVVCLRLVRRTCGAGRVAAAEVMIANEAVRALIRDAKTHQLRNVLLTSKHTGMQTLEMHLTDLVNRGEITHELACSVTDRPNDIQHLRFSEH